MKVITFVFALTQFVALGQQYRALERVECHLFEHCLERLDGLAAGSQLVSATVTLRRMSDYAEMNAAWTKHFAGQTLAARHTLEGELSERMVMALEGVLYTGEAAARPMTPEGVVNVAPVSPALLTPDRLFTAGILGRDSNSGSMPAAIAEQIEMCLARLVRVLSTDGLGLEDIREGVLYRTRVVQGWPLSQAMEARFGRGWRERIREEVVGALPLGANVAFQGWAQRRR